MASKEFEEKFAAFLDGQRYKTAQDALYFAARAAFIAGWAAAGGPPTGEYEFKPVDPSVYILKLREP